MDGFKPQKRPLSPQNGASRPVAAPTRPVQQPATPITPSPLESLLGQDTPSPELKKPKKNKKRITLGIIGALLLVIIIAIVASFMWYKAALSPVNASDKTRQRVDIAAGSSPADIADLLSEKKLIRSELAFDIYTRISGTRSTLQAGTFNLSPSESTEAIVNHLVSGKVDEFTLTFLPGATLAENRTVLIKAGYTEAEVDSALSKTYDHPLFTDKPASANLEGYIYGETYNFSSTATVEQILTKTFDEYYAKIQENDLINGYKAHGLNLYQGIILASIIQREVSAKADQKQVAQVFYTRLSIDMPLGADSTFIYGAQLLGVDPSVNLDSPYNTRIHKGLPPGPIASPGLTALIATASPASGDYLYFVSGDDGKNYFSRTLEEHEANTRQYCHVNCSLF